MWQCYVSWKATKKTWWLQLNGRMISDVKHCSPQTFIRSSKEIRRHLFTSSRASGASWKPAVIAKTPLAEGAPAAAAFCQWPRMQLPSPPHTWDPPQDPEGQFAGAWHGVHLCTSAASLSIRPLAPLAGLLFSAGTLLDHTSGRTDKRNRWCNPLISSTKRMAYRCQTRGAHCPLTTLGIAHPVRRTCLQHFQLAHPARRPHHRPLCLRLALPPPLYPHRLCRFPAQPTVLDANSVCAFPRPYWPWHSFLSSGLEWSWTVRLPPPPGGCKLHPAFHPSWRQVALQGLLPRQRTNPQQHCCRSQTHQTPRQRSNLLVPTRGGSVGSIVVENFDLHLDMTFVHVPSM
mmetsp:Transcript_29967/g.69714  ORF Transcript_29967/g.69714 Transcript_29967/m.69714 type:complete len:345 (+) Transcript_29967:60-1094(+)